MPGGRTGTLPALRYVPVWYLPVGTYRCAVVPRCEPATATHYSTPGSLRVARNVTDQQEVKASFVVSKVAS